MADIQKSQEDDFLSLLMKLGERQEVKNVWYNGKEVKLDGYKFIGCRFDSCKLSVESTNFEIEKCMIDEATVIKYGGEISKAVKLFTSRYVWLADSLPTLSPKFHDDGTLSISA